MVMKINLDELFKEIKDEKENQTDINSKVLIVDGLNLYLRAFSVNPTMNDNGTHIGGITGFFNSLCVAIRQMSPTRCIIVFDGKGGSQNRRKLFEGYKAQRRGLRVRLNRAYDFEDADEEHKNAMKQLLRIADYLDHLPITVGIYDNVEADDVIGYLAKDVLKEQVVIMSTDKDFIQLVDERISIWNPPKKKLYNPELIKEDYGVTPKNHIFLKMIEGDGSDNVSGIYGIGIKTIQKDLTLITSEVDVTWEEFKDYLHKAIDNKTAKKLINGTTTVKLEENKKIEFNNLDLMELNYKLMKLGEVEISGTTKSNIRELIASSVSTINNLKFKEQFLEDQLYGAIPNLDSWLRLNFSKLNAFALKSKT